ncbi:hypothetical protein ASD64_02075 [Mesorhizobium sp. Root157]|uniref:hypothetical protein n=1 Tax=Mesorhizobium sp. Root157 TaxID=1736477 RepID=UPI0006F66DF3|nr:hypothetical protein [Mesorhizobium sp. Root157]KRA00375.1 hypothetical protein ASD64_02075 [Mesorhizobium sp. Root157]
MADFVAVLKKTLDGLGETTPQMRARVYDKARSTVAAKLAAIEPAPPASVAERQTRALEDAIATVERGFAPPVAADIDPLAELDNIFSSIDKNKNQPNHVRPAAKAEPLSPNLEARPDPSWRKAEQAVWTEPAPPELPAAGNGPSYTAGEELETEGDRRGDVFASGDEPDGKRSYRGLIAAAVAVLVVAGGAYGVWSNKDAFQGMFASSDEPTPVVVKPVKVAPPTASETAAAETTPAPANNPASGNDAGEAAKFTQRLLPDGNETDPGPAGGESGIGEGTSVVALTTPPPAVAPTEPGSEGSATPPAAGEGTAPAAPEAQAAVPVGQKAIFYEERTSVAQGSAESGNIVWSLVQESPGGDAPPEPAIRGEATIPGKDVQLRLTIRRNADQTLPASHIIEMIFLTPDGFEGGGIENVLRIAMKAAEQEAGSPLIGIPAKIADGYFLVALNDTKADENANMTLLRNQDWIDVPVIYKSGRRALLTMEKGIPGDKVFDEALKAWQVNSAG